MAAHPVLVGRDVEREVLLGAVEDAARGVPSAVLVRGEAGVGKTSLVYDVVEPFRGDGCDVLWGRCLRFGAAAAAYLPVVGALSQWAESHDIDERSRVWSGLDELATLVPTLRDESMSLPAAPGGGTLAVVADALSRLAQNRPLVFVMDDLQWADESSLDLLAFVVGGFSRGQRLALVGTYRDTGLADGHPLHGWLADVRRMPFVTELALGRLDLLDTERLVTGLREAPAPMSLVEQVYARSDGLPYVAELLLRGAQVDRNGPTLGEHGLLREALLSSWHRLSPVSRHVMQLLAVGGRPVLPGVLTKLAQRHGLDPNDVASGVSEAVGAGLCTSSSAGVWFHHPLLAEVIATSVTQEGRAAIHLDYVDALLSEGLDSPGRAAQLALHYAAVPDDDETFTWSLRAAAEARAVSGLAERARHLDNACALWPRLSEGTKTATGQLVDLLIQAADSARQAGDFARAYALRLRALEAIDRSARPRDTARQLTLANWEGTACGQVLPLSPAPFHEGLSLLEAEPDCTERVVVLSGLSECQFWGGDQRSARATAALALAEAQRLGSAEAMATALGVRSQTHDDMHLALRDLQDASRWAAQGIPFRQDALLALWEVNILGALGRVHEAARRTEDRYRAFVAAGRPHDAVALGVIAAQWHTRIGDFDEAQDLIRLVLSRRSAERWCAAARSVAALIALRRGDTDSARQHLARARELPGHRLMPGNTSYWAECEIPAALGSWDQVAALIEELIPRFATVDAEEADEMMSMGARLAADHCARTPGAGVRDEVVAWLDRVEAGRGQTPAPFVTSGETDSYHPALAALYAAHRDRARGAPDQILAWEVALARCVAAGLLWDQAFAGLRLAEGMLVSKREHGRAAEVLRTAYTQAVDIGAHALVADIEALASQAHLSLKRLTVGQTDAADDPRLPSDLTPREHQVLAQLLTGATYGQIARTLFISEKTVSAHVSNLLRKTGTRSRIELAALVGGSPRH